MIYGLYITTGFGFSGTIYMHIHGDILYQFQWRHKSVMESQISSNKTSSSKAYSMKRDRKHQSWAFLALLWGIHHYVGNITEKPTKVLSWNFRICRAWHRTIHNIWELDTWLTFFHASPTRRGSVFALGVLLFRYVSPAKCHITFLRNHSVADNSS